MLIAGVLDEFRSLYPGFAGLKFLFGEDGELAGFVTGKGEFFPLEVEVVWTEGSTNDKAHLIMQEINSSVNTLLMPKIMLALGDDPDIESFINGQDFVLSVSGGPITDGCIDVTFEAVIDLNAFTVTENVARVVGKINERGPIAGNVRDGVEEFVSRAEIRGGSFRGTDVVLTDDSVIYFGNLAGLSQDKIEDVLGEAYDWRYSSI